PCPRRRRPRRRPCRPPRSSRQTSIRRSRTSSTGSSSSATSSTTSSTSCGTSKPGSEVASAGTGRQPPPFPEGGHEALVALDERDRLADGAAALSRVAQAALRERLPLWNRGREPPPPPDQRIDGGGGGAVAGGAGVQLGHVTVGEPLGKGPRAGAGRPARQP